MKILLMNDIDNLIENLNNEQKESGSKYGRSKFNCSWSWFGQNKSADHKTNSYSSIKIKHGLIKFYV